eukprot:m.227572 g.227572  ORF g.227572 m.227572 type:complete len:480 (-) comp11608_c0_seq1:358-1797(-)
MRTLCGYRLLLRSDDPPLREMDDGLGERRCALGLPPLLSVSFGRGAGAVCCRRARSSAPDSGASSSISSSETWSVDGGWMGPGGVAGMGPEPNRDVSGGLGPSVAVASKGLPSGLRPSRSSSSLFSHSSADRASSRACSCSSSIARCSMRARKRPTLPRCTESLPMVSVMIDRSQPTLLNSSSTGGARMSSCSRAADSAVSTVSACRSDASVRAAAASISLVRARSAAPKSTATWPALACRSAICSCSFSISALSSLMYLKLAKLSRSTCAKCSTAWSSVVAPLCSFSCSKRSSSPAMRCSGEVSLFVTSTGFFTRPRVCVSATSTTLRSCPLTVMNVRSLRSCSTTRVISLMSASYCASSFSERSRSAWMRARASSRLSYACVLLSSTMPMCRRSSCASLASLRDSTSKYLRSFFRWSMAFRCPVFWTSAVWYSRSDVCRRFSRVLICCCMAVCAFSVRPSTRAFGCRRASMSRASVA